MQIRFVILYEHDRIDIVAYSMLLAKLDSDLRLQRRKLKFLVRVIADNEVHHRIAIITNSVKENESLHLKILPQFSDRYQFRVSIDSQIWKARYFGKR